MRRIFYGWYLVGAATGLQFLQAGLMMQSFGAYVAVLGPALGWMLDRFGPRRFVRAGVVMFGLGLIGLSRVDTLPQFYAAFALIALGVSCCGFFPLNVAVIHWFERRRARAISSMSIGLALGGIMVPLVALSLETYGWRATAFASGLIAIVVGLPLAS
jgi:MFS family permease